MQFKMKESPLRRSSSSARINSAARSLDTFLQHYINNSLLKNTNTNTTGYEIIQINEQKKLQPVMKWNLHRFPTVLETFKRLLDNLFELLICLRDVFLG